MWWRFLRAIKDREHRLAPTTVVVALAAVVYTLVPIDLIPELVLGPFGFVDDISIRLTAWGSGTRVDVRSVSRTGIGDAGRNADRIRGFLKELQR